MNRKILAVGIGILLSTGCAQKADNIKATYVSQFKYDKHTCSQLKAEVIDINEKLFAISREQDRESVKDTITMGVGLIVFLPTLLFLAGGEDQKAEIGHLKGEYDAIRKAAERKNCSFTASMK